MDLDDEFLRNAAEAQRWAERSRSPEVKAGWLRVARGWLSLLSKSPPCSEPEDTSAGDARADRSG